MGLLSSKPKVQMALFCKDYYDSQIFHAIVNGEDASQKILDAAFQLLSESDPSFARVDRIVFENEMTAMHLELFSLAFFRRFSNFDRAVQHSVFTRGYLLDKDRLDIWEAMGEYCRIIAQTATMNASGQLMTGDTGIERMTIGRVNVVRFELFKKWRKTHCSDPENLTANEKETAGCVGRVCNRVEADILRNKEIGNRQIAGTFLSRLGGEEIYGQDWTPSEDFGLRLVSQPLSMYEFANSTLKTVDLQF